VTFEYQIPRLIAGNDEVDSFHCRSDEQTNWLQKFAKQSASSGTTRVFVVTPKGSRRVVAYYAWCMAPIDIASASARLQKGAGRYPQPVALLARLGVDDSHEGHGLGAGLLANAISRLLTLSTEIGCRGLLIHSESSIARDFYVHLIPELEQSPTDPLHLLLLVKDARRTLLS
jgi:GNAT superfamily N-acetyltransferase